MEKKTYASAKEMFEEHDKELNKIWARRFWGRVLPGGIMDYYAGYALTHPWKVVARIKDELKYAWQRIRRGYDNLLLWNLYSHITEHSLAALRFMKEYGMGYPAGMESEEWDGILQEMITGFEAAERIEERDDLENYEKDLELFKHGFDLVKEYYFTLWD